MELSKSTWYVKLYLWCLQIVDKSRPGDEHGRASTYYEDYRYSTNLCQFIRVIFIWAPFVILLNLGAYVFAVAIVTYIPILYFGFGIMYIKTILIMSLSICSLVGFFFLMALAINWYEKHHQSRLDPTFRSLVWKRVTSTKEKYLCRFITIK